MSGSRHSNHSHRRPFSGVLWPRGSEGFSKPRRDKACLPCVATHTLRHLWLVASLLLLLGMLGSGATSAAAAGVKPLAMPACTTTFLPETLGEVPYYSAPNGSGTLLGETTWYPNWDDTVGWNETEVEGPAYVDLTGGWNDGIPSSSSTACIASGTLPLAGPTAATTGDAYAGTLEVSAGATLDITVGLLRGVPDDFAADLVVSGNTYNSGAIALNSLYGALNVGGTLYNSGTITTDAGNGAATLSGSVNNAGTLNVNGTVDLDQGASGVTFTNTGTVNIASSQTLDFSPADTTSIFNLAGGTINNDGAFYQDGGAFSHTGGSTAGIPLVVDDANLSANPSSGEAAFTVDNGTDTLTSDVGATDSITLSSSNDGTAHGDLATAFGLPSVTNYGAISLGSGNTLSAGGGTALTNAAVITDTGAGVIAGDVTNTGTLNADGNLTIGLGSDTTFTNTGAVTIASGYELSVNPTDTTSVFDMAGGTLTNNSTFYQYGGTFEQTGGQLSGNAPEINNAALAPCGGGGMLSINDGADTLTTNIGVNQVLILGSSNGGLNGATLTTGLASLTNAGYIELTISNDSVRFNNLTNTGVVETFSGGSLSTSSMTNTGNLYFNGGTFNGNFINEGGLIVTDSASVDPGNAGVTFTNTDTGAITISAGQTLSVGADTFDFNGGTITNNGSFDQTGGAFNHNAGTATGNPLLVINAALSVAPTAGSVAIAAGGTDNLTTDIGADETINLEGTLGNDSSSNPTTNNGVLNLGDGVVNISQLANTGTLTAGSAQINGLLNDWGGSETFTVNGETTIQSFAQNSGTVTIAVGADLGISGTVNYFSGTMTNDGGFGAAGDFVLYGGTITNNGFGNLSLAGGTFQQLGGVISGAPVSVYDETLELVPFIGSPAGSVSFADSNGTSTLIGGIPAGDAVTLSDADPGEGGPSGMLDTGAFTNAGTINFFYAGELHNTGTITNTGAINVEGYGRIDGALINAGTVNANPLTMGLVAGPGELMLLGNFTQPLPARLKSPLPRRATTLKVSTTTISMLRGPRRSAARWSCSPTRPMRLWLPPATSIRSSPSRTAARVSSPA